MRILAFITLALVLGAGPASAWEEYNYLDQGVAIQFPVKPQAMRSTYDSTYAKGLPSMVYSAEDDHVLYKLTVIDLASRQVRQLTQGRGSCEYPSWAPNGRHLVFSCEKGKKWDITVSDRQGTVLRTLSTGPGNNVQPDWGP